MFDLRNPELRWCDLARGMGVEAERVETAEDFTRAFADAMKQRGSRLIEVML